jgi:hypothetical protein
MVTVHARPPEFEAMQYDAANPGALAEWLPETSFSMALAVVSADETGFVVSESEPIEGGSVIEHPGIPTDWVLYGPGISVIVMSDADFHAEYVEPLPPETWERIGEALGLDPVEARSTLAP